VSTTSEPHDSNLLEQTRRQINRLVDEITRLSEADLPPTEYYGEFLQRVLTAVAAPAGAVWIRTPQGHLQLQYQVNMQTVGLDGDNERQIHSELLRAAAQMARPQMLPPHSGIGPQEEGKIAPGNPTDFVILLAPILVDKQVAGLVEVWQNADRNPNAQHGFLQFITKMAELASAYTRNHQLRQMIGQQALWTQLEAFARQVHNSLNPTEVAYLVANEGRRLIDCDRVSVAQRLGKKSRVEAVSGSDIVEKRSNLVRLMAKLFDAVLKWGEKLIYQGHKDDSLPPDVLHALDDFLAESNSKLLVVLPLQDEREKENEKPSRSAMMMECFDPAASPEQLVARMEVVGRHSANALYNASEHKRIPMRFIWMPIAKVQEGLGGKTRAIIAGVTAAAALLALVMVFVPYPLKMDSKGSLLPKERAYIYSPVDAKIVEFKVEPNQEVKENDVIAEMFSNDLAQKMISLINERDGAQAKASMAASQIPRARDQEKSDLESRKVEADITRKNKNAELEAFIAAVHGVPNAPGHFYLTSPIAGTILSSSFKDEAGSWIKQNQPVMRVGNKSGPWEVELKIPEKHIGQVLQAYDYTKSDDLDVEIILRSSPTKTYWGKLSKSDKGGEATPNRDENNESDPVVLAYVRTEGDDIDAASRLPKKEELLVAGTEVVAKVRCGNHCMGYSLFYGVWEFICEKVIFFF
jgi:HlyD family secretion protein